MEYGGITPVGLPAGWRVLVDPRVLESRSRSSAPAYAAPSCCARLAAGPSSRVPRWSRGWRDEARLARDAGRLPVLAAACTAMRRRAGRSCGHTARPGVPTITVSALPSRRRPTRCIADMRQSSRDAAAGRMEVWIDNDTAEDVTPTRITYVDGRFRTPLEGTRLREIPSQSTRGFQFLLPARPTCGDSNDVEATSSTRSAPSRSRTARPPRPSRSPTRPTSPAATRGPAASRSRSARSPTLSWSDQVTPGDPTEVEVGSNGTLTLVLDTDRRGRRRPRPSTRSPAPRSSPPRPVTSGGRT